LDQPGQDSVCEHCGAQQSTDLDICIICGLDRGIPTVKPMAPDQAAPKVPMQPPEMMAPPPPVPKARISIGLIIGVIGFMLAVIAIASMSWFVIESTDGDFGVFCGLREIETRYDNNELANNEYSRTYIQMEEEMGNELDMRGVAGASFWLLVIGLTLAGMFILFALLSLIGVFRGITVWLPMLTGLVAGLLIIIAASYFGAAFQDALEKDLDTELVDSEDTDHGLGGSWYMALFGGIMILMAAFLVMVRPVPYPSMEPMR
jgi:uncharacterized membrane protein